MRCDDLFTERSKLEERRSGKKENVDFISLQIQLAQFPNSLLASFLSPAVGHSMLWCDRVAVMALRMQFKLCLMMYKAMHTLHIYPSSAKVPVLKVELGRLLAATLYIVQRTRTKFGGRAFVVAGPAAWNRRHFSSLLTFNSIIISSYCCMHCMNHCVRRPSIGCRVMAPWKSS